jgi:hypothetical protein
VLPVGSGQTLTVTFTPDDTTDFKAVNSSVSIDVLPRTTSSQAMVIGEQPVFQRKHNRNGKSIGKPVLVGFTLEFNTPLSAAPASIPENYELDTVSLKKIKKNLVRELTPVRGFTVSYTPALDSVTLKLTGTRSFPNGGQITVLPGVTTGSDSVLIGTTVFTITPGGKSIVPA